MWEVPVHSGYLYSYTVLDIDHQKDGLVVVLSEDLVNLNIMGLEGVAGRVPANKLFLLADLHHHIRTFFIMSNIDS